MMICMPFGLQAHLHEVSPRKVHLSETRLARADSAIMDAVMRKEIPGAVLGIVRHGHMAYKKAYGYRQVYPTKEPMTTGTMFDMASCSKSMSTAISVMQLCENGTLRLTDPVANYIPEFNNWQDKDGNSVTIRIQHLLTHTSGLPAYASVEALSQKYGTPNPQGLLEHICQIKRQFVPGTDFQYSCLNYIVLQNIIQNCTGQSLRTYAKEHIFQPLGMNHTDYLPIGEQLSQWGDLIAPTTKQDDGSVLRGQVHDPLARVMNGGISGNAGVFSTVDDIATLCAALQNGGKWKGARILSEQSVMAMRTVPDWAKKFGRTYGWDVSSPYASCNGELLSPETYGHTGYTGTSIVIDPVNDISIILLVNAVHPVDGKSRMVRLRALISNIVASALMN
ncbi:MAG: serine hydrolase domain-containing protein [Bacteroidaceae bacterium]